MREIAFNKWEEEKNKLDNFAKTKDLPRKVHLELSQHKAWKCASEEVYTNDICIWISSYNSEQFPLISYIPKKQISPYSSCNK